MDNRIKTDAVPEQPPMDEQQIRMMAEATALFQIPEVYADLHQFDECDDDEKELMVG
jgi:uncharacterized protein YneF (UPF0154 family)